MYSTPNIFRVGISRRRAGHVARMEEGRNIFKILTGTPTGKIPLTGLSVDGKTISEWFLKKYVSIEGLALFG